MDDVTGPQIAMGDRAGRWLVDEHLFWEAGQWQALQDRALAAHLKHAGSTAFYRDRLGGVDVAAPLHQLPFTTKDQVAHAGAAVHGCAAGDVREWICTSGTFGRPLYVPLTASDLDRLAANEATALGIAGVGRGDTFVLAVGMDRLFVAGMAYWLGAQRRGAACLRVGPQQITQPDLVAELFARCGPGYVVAVPSFLAQIEGLEAVRGPVKGLIAIGEPTRTETLEYTALAARLAETFGGPVMSTYASTETCATFAEGPRCRGGHLNPQMAVVEIVDDQGARCPAGQVGEVVVTPLGVQGMPLVRFRTGDMAALFDDACPCGRTTPRLGPIVGRRQQLLKVRGTSLYPPALHEALGGVRAVLDFVIVAEEESPLSDVVTLFVQLKQDTPEVRAAIEQRMRALLRVLPKMNYCDGRTLRELQYGAGARKPQRFIDRRPGHTAGSALGR